MSISLPTTLSKWKMFKVLDESQCTRFLELPSRDTLLLKIKIIGKKQRNTSIDICVEV